MPTTHHSSGAERHFQAEHTHEAAAASRDKTEQLNAHEQQKFAEERAREQQEHRTHADDEPKKPVK